MNIKKAYQQRQEFSGIHFEYFLFLVNCSFPFLYRNQQNFVMSNFEKKNSSKITKNSDEDIYEHGWDERRIMLKN